MIVAANYSSTGSTNLAVQIPGRQKCVGVQLAACGAGDVASSNITLYASPRGDYQNSSGVSGAPMYEIFAHLNLYVALNGYGNQAIYVPLPEIPVANNVYLFSRVSGGMTCFFTGIFYFK